MKAERTQYQVTLEAMPGSYNSPEVRRLAKLIKSLGRRWGYRVVTIRPVKEEGKP